MLDRLSLMKPVSNEGKMDALFDKVVKAVKEIGLPTVMCFALCAYIWLTKEDAKKEREATAQQYEIIAQQSAVNQERMLNTINKNTEAFNILSKRIDEITSEKSRKR